MHSDAMMGVLRTKFAREKRDTHALVNWTVMIMFFMKLKGKHNILFQDQCFFYPVR